MAKETLLDTDIDAGARFIQALDESGKTVDAALWFYYPDLSQWKLLLSSQALEEKDLTKSYTKISEILSAQDDIGSTISVSDVKLLNNTDPMMKLLKGIVRTGGSHLSRIRMTSNVFDGIYVEDALIYRNT
jgi:hypothetical protein